MLMPVTGNRTLCAPCALSAVTGLPSETWPDETMQQSTILEALKSAGFAACTFDDWLPCRLLRFGHPVWIGLDTPKETLAHPAQWLLGVVFGFEGVKELELRNQREAAGETVPPFEVHLVAISVQERGGQVIRRLADNRCRHPSALSHLVQRLPWSQAWVVYAVRVFMGVLE